MFARVKGTPYAGLAGFQGQAKETEHGGFFRYPGKVEREGAAFENEFKLRCNESTTIVLASDIEILTCHAMPVKWMDKFNKPEYKWQRCSRFVTRVRADGTGFDLVALPGNHKCQYCEDPVFGNTPRAITVVLVYTVCKHTTNKGAVIGPRLTYLTLTDRDLPMLTRLANDAARYGALRKSATFPQGTLVGMKYNITRGAAQQSRAVGEAIDLLRGEDDRPDTIDPEKMVAWMGSQIKQGKFKALNVQLAYPIASSDEQKLLLRNAQSLNEKYNFVKGGGATVNLPGAGSAGGIVGDDLLGMGGAALPAGMDDDLGLTNKANSMSKLKEQIRKERSSVEMETSGLPEGGDEVPVEDAPVKSTKSSKAAPKAAEDDDAAGFEDDEEEIASHVKDEADAFDLDDEDEEEKKPKRGKK